MATYTDNYNLKKPTYAEPANVKDINENMDMVDDIMHSSQVSLADAYDLNSTYNTGDKVMYEMLMYKCKEDGVTGAWDASKWERTTAVEGSGGADLDIYGEASGTAEASFSDGAEASLVECEIGIVPSQDLHGYSKPWAGGAGKNKLPNTQGNESKNGVTCTKNSDGTYTFTGTASASSYFIVGQVNIPAGTYTLSGCPTGGGSSTYRLYFENPIGVNDTGSGASFTISEQTLCNAVIVIVNGCVLPNEGIIFEPMVRLSTESSTFEPYSNICPISGHTDVTVKVASTSGGSGEDYTVSLGSTYYGGNLDVTKGELEVTWGNIASYAGETLTGEWLSSLDEYSALGTPTTGAQVVYELATPQTFNLTPTQVKTLLGQNYVSHDGGGTISLVYVKGDAPIKPNPTGADIPLKGLEIDGEKFKIAGGEYSETSLYTYTGSTRQTTLELSDDFTEYDAIEFTFGWNLGGDDFETVNVVPSSKIASGIFVNVGGEGRYNYISKGTSNSEIILATAQGSWDGSSIIREVRGIKY